jgi:LEA14-like dessication related protein
MLLALIAFTGCSGVDEVKITGADGFALKEIKNNVVTFSANVGVQNPSRVAFRVKDLNLKASVDGNFIGTLTTNDKIKINARSDTSYLVNFALDLANMLTGASTLYSLARRSQVTIDLQGYVTASSWFSTRKVPVSESRKVDIPSLYR